MSLAEGLRWRATVDEDGQYSFTVALDDAERRALLFANLRRSTILRYDSILDYIRYGYMQDRMSKSGPQCR
jgi:hypothetical protein